MGGEVQQTNITATRQQKTQQNNNDSRFCEFLVKEIKRAFTERLTAF